ncbi:YqgE/AlgH family protein [Nocardioides panacis]|uniref:YqgE/AlgH family protein n=1 Tax=Nocardioides panacis TaxID=2849501 RepID=UPI00345EE42C
MPDHRAARLRVGDLLVATPALLDPNFEHTVVLVLDLDDNGALGVVLNRPSTVLVSDVLPGWDDVVRTPDVLFQGGPVSTDSALAVGASMTYGVDPNVEPVGFRRLYDDVGIVDLDTPTEIVAPALTGMRVFAGYAGWGGTSSSGRRSPRGPGTSCRPWPRTCSAPTRPVCGCGCCAGSRASWPGCPPNPPTRP